MKDWFISSFDTLLLIVVSAVLVYALIILYTRIFGLRSFSKMSSFDFAMTVAIGSLLSSSIISKSPSVMQGGVAILSLYSLQMGIALLRRKFTWFNHVIDNRPLLLMHGSQLLHENMKKARISEDDLRAKLRESNVLHYDQVKAVVLETTGDFSVLTSQDQTELDPDLLKDVRGIPHV